MVKNQLGSIINCASLYRAGKYYAQKKYIDANFKKKKSMVQCITRIFHKAWSFESKKLAQTSYFWGKNTLWDSWSWVKAAITYCIWCCKHYMLQSNIYSYGYGRFSAIQKNGRNNCYILFNLNYIHVHWTFYTFIFQRPFPIELVWK